jgi:adenine C2-methylase RlmN of 23S rRNA A2503 and tRNA A37
MLEQRGVPVAVRASRGAEVLAACGQLAARLTGQAEAGRA